MFGPTLNEITENLLIDRLIKETEYDPKCFWRREDHKGHTCYFYSSQINNTKSINFKIYHFKTHDMHMLNVSMAEKNNSRFIPVLVIQEYKVYNLIKTIRDSVKYYYKKDDLFN